MAGCTTIDALDGLAVVGTTVGFAGVVEFLVDALDGLAVVGTTVGTLDGFLDLRRKLDDAL